MKEKQSKLKVQTLYKQGRLIKKEEETEEIEVIRLDDEAATCTISVDKTVTVNLGNFNSLKIGGFMSVPSYLDEQCIDEAFDFASNQLSTKLEALLSEEMQNVK